MRICPKCKKNEQRKQGGYCRSCATLYHREWLLKKEHTGHPKGSSSHNWKGGGLSTQGYRQTKISGKSILQHRVVMEKMIGRPLLRREVVHHWDEDRLNNKPENLCLFRSPGIHSMLHKFAERHGLSISILKFQQPWLIQS